MSWFRFFLRKHRDAELTAEIEQHLAREIEDNMANGMSREEARRQAHLKIGRAHV